METGTGENAIFVCYRREDSNPATHGIHQRLQAAFGPRTVFLDHHGFKGGDAWREKTAPIIRQARAVVVVINKDWLTIGKNRLTESDDPVRQELELALASDADIQVIPVLVDKTPSPNRNDAEVFRQTGHAELADLLARLFAKTALKIRFDRDFEPDIQMLIGRLEEVPGIQRVGAATSFDVGGLQVVRPWDMTAHRPSPRPGDSRASDLWILQPKYRATEMVGRDEDLAALSAWLESEAHVSARLLVGRAGAGKTRLGFELIWKVFREKAHEWDAGIVDSEALRRERDWSGWIWRRPTLLMLDYAHALEEAVTRMFLALARRMHDQNLPPLRILLAERQASAKEGWFRRLLDLENSAGGGPVRDVFEPPEPVSLHPLETPALRRAVLSSTLTLAAEHDGQPALVLPEPEANADFDRRLEDARWSDPLYLMMAALVGRRRWLEGGSDGQGRLLEAFSLGRGDLAEQVAKHELRRLELFTPTSGGDADRRLLRHLAACATLSGGFTEEEARDAAKSEADALGLVWPAGPGDLASRLADALPTADRGVASVQPDIVGEAVILLSLRDAKLSARQQRETVLRSARRKPKAVVAVLFHAFQSFAADDERTATLLDWIDAVITNGLSENPGWLLAIEASMPQQTTVLREAAARVGVSEILCK